MECYRDNYKNGLHLLSLSKEQELSLVDVLECMYDTATNLPYDEVLERRDFLKMLFEIHGEVLKEECYSLWYMIRNMENNYRFILKLKEVD